MEIYKSKIGIGLVIFIVLILGISSYPMITERNWAGLLPIIIVALFITYLFNQTYYVIQGNFLRVKSGFIINKTYDINRITKITETNNPLGAPAASLDRLEILMDNYQSVIISPKEKSSFIGDLTKINPKIVVSLKRNKGK